MRLRTAVVSLGITAGVAFGMSAPAHAAISQPGVEAQAAWSFGGLYSTKSRCIDAGQQYQREGWSYKCAYGYQDTVGEGWLLWIR